MAESEPRLPLYLLETAFWVTMGSKDLGNFESIWNECIVDLREVDAIKEHLVQYEDDDDKKFLGEDCTSIIYMKEDHYIINISYTELRDIFISVKNRI